MKFNKFKPTRKHPLKDHPAYLAGVADRERLEAGGISFRLLLPPRRQMVKWKQNAAYAKYFAGWEDARKRGLYPENGVRPLPMEPLTNAPVTLDDWPRDRPRLTFLEAKELTFQQYDEAFRKMSELA